MVVGHSAALLQEAEPVFLEAGDVGLHLGIHSELVSPLPELHVRRHQHDAHTGQHLHGRRGMSDGKLLTSKRLWMKAKKGACGDYGCVCRVRAWSGPHLVGYAEELRDAFHGSLMRAVVDAEAVVSDNHHLHEEGPPVRQQRPVQLNAFHLPGKLLLKT